MIRPARPEDAREIAKLTLDIRRDTVPLIHDEDSVENFVKNVLIPQGSTFVYEVDGTIAAWCDAKEGWLDQLYCRREQTGKGIGKALLDHAKAENPTGLKLYTFQVNTGARRFYKREGFEEIELSDGSENEEKRPDVLMEWRPVKDILTP